MGIEDQELKSLRANFSLEKTNFARYMYSRSNGRTSLSEGRALLSRPWRGDPLSLPPRGPGGTGTDTGEAAAIND